MSSPDKLKGFGRRLMMNQMHHVQKQLEKCANPLNNKLPTPKVTAQLEINESLAEFDNDFLVHIL